jgi:thioredoxin reductase (NADPH)
VAVVGYSQEAKDELQVLTGFASTVHWIVPGVPHADDESAQDILALPNVKQWSNTRLLSIEGDDSGVRGIVLKKTGMAESSKDEDDFPANGNEVFLQAEMVFIYVAGSKPVTDFLSDQQIAIKDDGGEMTYTA